MKAEYTQLDIYLQTVAADIRSRLGKANQRRIELTIELEGRVDGDLMLTYKIGEYGHQVSGRNLDELVTEYLRRKGWDERHQPLCLPNAGEPRPATKFEDDEIKF